MFALFAPASMAGAQTNSSIQSIRQAYTRINRNTPRYRKVKKDLLGFSVEGGELLAYFDGDSIMKMVARYYGETGRATDEFYFAEGKLIFVFRKEQRYDRPLSGKVVRNFENRFYFSGEKLIRWIDEGGKQIAATNKAFTEKQSEHLKTSKQLAEGARSDKTVIESSQ